ncbi:MAG: phosphoribosylaminoimidazolesuccinocarboxamide synthase, partial [Chloroflexi bacterium]|nr:phosphoribosylaminoimidazolesuccinocarboxamide synthase [Chloroflexota bacterium]
MDILLDSSLKLPVYGKGKVRDTYRVGDKLLMLATDRISAFDFVLPNSIPDKGIVLNQISAFWFGKTYHLVHNHLVESVESRRALLKYS